MMRTAPFQVGDAEIELRRWLTGDLQADDFAPAIPSHLPTMTATGEAAVRCSGALIERLPMRCSILSM
jgi:hypothetical protein